MSLDQDPDFWEDLLTFIEDGKVIPVVGEAAVTYGPDNQPLYPWLALRLAERLGLSRSSLGKEPRLNDVVAAHLLAGGTRNAVYTRLFRILRDESLPPGPTLLDLAQITAFRLYLTTTFDDLLERALRQVRAGGHPHVPVLAFHPGAVPDLPVRTEDLQGPLVFHLFGRVASSAGEFVAWDEDLLDFICELQRHIGTDVMHRLARDLKTHNLLAFGLSFADWPVRFLLRVTRQESLSRVQHSSYIAEGPPGMLPPGMVMFFGGVSPNIRVIECDPGQFATELARRWRERHPRVATTPDQPWLRPASGAIFISYAREDAAAAERVKALLEQHGCVIWYDRERLQPAQDADHTLRDEVQKRCSIFVSLISRHTETAIGDHYFRLERNWAAARAERFSDVERPEFYIPVIVDPELPSALMHEPRLTEQLQWTHAPAGQTTDAFARRLAAIQRKHAPHLFGSV